MTLEDNFLNDFIQEYNQISRTYSIFFFLPDDFVRPDGVKLGDAAEFVESFITPPNKVTNNSY